MTDYNQNNSVIEIIASKNTIYTEKYLKYIYFNYLHYFFYFK